MKRVKSKFERARRDHLSYLKACWQGCIELSESLIGERSSDSLDIDARRAVVFELATHFFIKNAPSLEEFAILRRVR